MGCYKRNLSRSDALREMQRLQVLKQDDAKTPLNVYRCLSCRRWHVGHKALRLNRSA